MRSMLVMFLLVTLVTGCSNDRTEVIEGKISQINQDEMIIFLGDSLTNEQKSSMNFDKDKDVIEAFTVKVDQNLNVKGEVNSIEELNPGHKVSVSILGEYEKNLVTFDEFMNRQGQLPSYRAEQVEAIPITKEDIIKDLTVDEEYYGLYIYNSTPNEDDGYSIREFINHDQFQTIEMKLAGYSNQHQQELLGIKEDTMTYIITDHEGMLLKTESEEELKNFLED